MRLTFLGVVVSALLCAQAPTSPAGLGGNQRGLPELKGPTPRLADGKPDFSGVWIGGGPVGDLALGMPKGEAIPLLPAAAELMKKRQSKDDPEANCLPTGIPRTAPYPWTFANGSFGNGSGNLYMLFEGNIHSYRQIFMDGRAHPKDLNPTWYGHSVGHWDGETLVIDTIGFNDLFWFDFRGHPHTEQLHTTERYTRLNFGTLENKTTIDDPGAYSKPFTITFNARLMPKGELMEYICQENNQDVNHIKGPAGTP